MTVKEMEWYLEKFDLHDYEIEDDGTESDCVSVGTQTNLFVDLKNQLAQLEEKMTEMEQKIQMQQKYVCN